MPALLFEAAQQGWHQTRRKDSREAALLLGDVVVVVAVEMVALAPGAFPSVGSSLPSLPCC